MAESNLSPPSKFEAIKAKVEGGDLDGGLNDLAMAYYRLVFDYAHRNFYSRSPAMESQDVAQEAIAKLCDSVRRQVYRLESEGGLVNTLRTITRQVMIDRSPRRRRGRARPPDTAPGGPAAPLPDPRKPVPLVTGEGQAIDVADSIPSPSKFAQESERQEALEALVPHIRSLLRPDQWYLFNLFYRQGASHQEIAELLKLETGQEKTRETIRQRLYVIRQQLAEQIKDLEHLLVRHI